MFTIKEEQMMRAITEHKDFGKRNPVDIGIECGYTEKEILDMIQKISGEQDIEKNKNDEKTERTKYYFLIEGKFGEEKKAPWIVSVNIQNWETKTVKKMENYQYIGGRFCIKDSYLVYQKGSRSVFMNDFGDAKILYWENLETGEKRKLLLDSNIKNFSFWNGNIFVITEDEILLWDTEKIIKRIERDNYISGYTIVTTENKLYLIDTLKVYEVNTSLSYKEVWDGYRRASDYRIGAVEFIDNDLTWYVYKEEVLFFADNSWSYRKYRKKGGNNCSTDHEGFNASKVGANFEPLKGVFTKNYRLLQEEIYTIDNKKKICDFPRKTDSYSNQGQVVAIPDKDIFIGVTSAKIGDFYGVALKEDAIIKIDLQEERNPEILLIKFESK